MAVYKTGEDYPRQKVVQHSTCHRSRCQWKPETSGGKGKCSAIQSFISHLTCDRTNCDLLKTTWDHQWWLEETASSTTLSQQCWKEALAMLAITPHSTVCRNQVLSAEIFC